MEKQFQLLILSLLFFVNFASAQISEEERPMSLGVNNALIVEIANTDKGIAERVWKDYMKKYKGKTKKKRKEQHFTTEKVKLPAITGQESARMFAQIAGDDSQAELALWVPTAQGYVSSETHPEAYEAAAELLEDYALEVRIATVEQELESGERILDRHKKDLRKLEKENKDYHNKIKDSEKGIRDAEQDIVDNGKEQQLVETRLSVTEDYFSEINDSLNTLLRDATTKDEKKRIKKAIKEEERKVKDVEKELKKLKREEKKSYRSIDNFKETIKKAEDDIVKNKIEQETTKTTIEQQKEIVEEIKSRLNRVKGYRN